MKKYFVAYRFTGEDPDVLHDRMSTVVDSLKKVGIDGFCNLFDEKEYQKSKFGAKEIMDIAFNKIDNSEGVFVVIASDDKSEGLLMEIGYAYAKKKHIIVAVHEDATTYAPSIGNQSIVWRDNKDLAAKIEAMKL